MMCLIKSKEILISDIRTTKKSLEFILFNKKTEAKLIDKSD